MRSPIGERDGSDEAELEFQTPVLKRLRISMDGRRVSSSLRHPAWEFSDYFL
jgi:hypothetical protein